MPKMNLKPNRLIFRDIPQENLQSSAPVFGEAKTETQIETTETTKAAEQTNQQLQTLSEATTPSFLRYSNVPCGTPENLEDVDRAIRDAFKLMEKTGLAKKAKKVGLKFESPDFYIPIAIKESKLNPSAISPSGARGYFQITQKAVDDVEGWFGRDALPHNLDSTAQVMIGILLYHLYRDLYPNLGAILEFKMPLDRELFATFAYNIGIGDAKDLWEALEVTTYDEFELKLSELLIQNSEERLEKADNENQIAKDYNVYVKLPFKKNQARTLLHKILGKNGTVNLYKRDKNYKEETVPKELITIGSARIMEALNFTRVIDSIRNGNHVKKLKRDVKFPENWNHEMYDYYKD